MASSPLSGPSQSDDIVLAPICAIFRRFLKRQGLKFTTERAAVLDAVLTMETAFEVESLIDDLKAAGHRVSKATVYRTMKHLVDSGILREVLIESRQARYQLVYGRKPKDYIVLVGSDEVVEFYAPEIIALRERLAAEHGLNAIGHQFLIYALPPDQASDGD